MSKKGACVRASVHHIHCIPVPLLVCLLSIKLVFFPLPLGQCVKSIYTFNAVTALCFVPEGDGYIVTGSGVFYAERMQEHLGVE